MRPCIPVACLQTHSGWASEQGRGQKRECEKMPHVEQCDLVLFPSNIHKQEQTNMAGQSNCNFLFTVKLDFKDMLAFLFLNRMIQCLIIICLFTSITLLRLIRGKKEEEEEGGGGNIAPLKYTTDTCTRVRTHTGPLHSYWLGLWAVLWRRSTSQCFLLCVCLYRPWKKIKATKANRVSERASLFVNVKAFPGRSQKSCADSPPGLPWYP